MTDAELIARLRSMHWCVTTKANGVGVSDSKVALAAADRIEALTEQLTAARDDAKEAEAYAEEVEADRKKTYEALLKVSRIHGEVEAKLTTCEKYRDAYAECDRIGTQAVRDLEAKLTLMTTERDEAWKRAAHAEKVWGEAEVKLAEAVEALELIVVDSTWGLEHQTYMKCRKALAEIKGESHA